MNEYPSSVSKQCSIKILEQMDNFIYKLNEKDFGFFCHIKYKHKNIPIFITNYHAINEKYIEKNNNIKITKNKEIITIEFGKKYYINEKYNISILEIKEDNINKIYFFDLDENIYEKEPEMNYYKESIYIIHNKQDKNTYVSYGIINEINKSDIIFSCNIDNNL